MKFVIALLLLCTAVPAGCLPLLAAGAALDAARPQNREGRPLPQTEGSQGFALGAAAVMAGLALAATLAFRQVLRRTRRLDEAEEWLGLGQGAWQVLLWTSFVLGLGCSVSMIVSAMSA